MQSTSDDKPEECGVSVENSVGEIRSSSIKMLKQSCDVTADNDDASTSQMKQDESLHPHPRREISESAPGTKVIKYGSLVETDLTIGLAPSSSSSQKPGFIPIEDRGEINKQFSAFQQGPWSRQILPKVPKTVMAQGFDPNAMNSQIRVARPPVEGRIKNQLLPRYWPRITEQELQQISGEYPCLMLLA